MTSKNEFSRRSLVKVGAAAAAAGVAALAVPPWAQASSSKELGVVLADVPTLSSQDAQAEAEKAEIRQPQFGFLVKARHCVNCQACVRSCRRHNETPAGAPARRKVTVYHSDGAEDVYLSTSCMHCVEPACVAVCPAGAIVKGDGGLVTVQPERCIGCKYCYQACPFGVPAYNKVSMDKCDGCQGNGVPLGEDPWCVRACKFDALHFGPLDDLKNADEGAQVVEASTKPAFVLA
ncbi:4Fe-4S dicluster domain-containing protein [uncultured Adlercreutzia sp.]|uniref:4Fe-4S dicluster domain-containing protein n=1 Tax=uncultured Adlercreutzia sp. TaxID=875803 RepID=UPI0025E2D025|nr:4Fe-4S dicluster domain-containing protein [uncultured Adlercreutzia sp.]MCI9261329.1 4Fe-4S dicluster domain-containing protein [Eggerthellaceae bacterium]